MTRYSLFTTRLASASLFLTALALSVSLAPHAEARGPRHESGGPQEWLTQYYLPLPAPGSKCGVYCEPDYERLANAVFDLTNAQRAKKGHTPLTRNAHLDAVAQAHAVHMAEARFFDHASPYGMEVFERLDAAGCPRWNWAGENIAAGYRTPEIAMKEWMDSSGHRKNIRNESYREMGVGVYYDPDTEYGWFWVQVFATFEGGHRAGGAEHETWITPIGGSGQLTSSAAMATGPVS